MSATQQGTALVLPGRIQALLAIYDDLLYIASRLLQRSLTKGRSGPSLSRCRKIVEGHVIWSSTPGVPFVGSPVTFGGEIRRAGTTIVPKTTRDGTIITDENGDPKWELGPLEDVFITGKIDLPVKDSPNRREPGEVIPLVACNGKGGLVPYVNVGADRQLRAGRPMLCIFIRDFDLQSNEENGRIRAIPLGLARAESIDRWNGIAKRMAEQDPTRGWEEIPEISSNLGRAFQYLTLQPQGPAANYGQLPVYKPREDEAIHPQKTKYFLIVTRLGGKIATLDKNSQNIIVQEGKVPEQIFVIEENWNGIRLIVWGLPGEVGAMESKEVDLGEINIDALACFKVTLYDADPRSGPVFFRRALQSPPMDYMVGEGWIAPGSSHAAAAGMLRGMSELLRNRLGEQITQARQDIYNALGPSGQENQEMPSLQDILGGDPAPELLRVSFDREDEDLLATWILTKPAVQNLGLEIWDSKCWVLREVRRDLLMSLARMAGVELAPRS